jgi:hypothetical protein
MAKKKQSLPKRSWAFLGYIAGDNNLSEAGLEDISEMCEFGSSKHVHAAVQIDTEGDFDGVVRYEISQPDATGAAHRVVVQRLAELDSGDPEVLRSSLRWGLTRYPATKRVVVIWNHGAGFRARLPRRDIAYDDSGTSLDMNEIDGVFQKVGVTPQKRLSILGFDACLMSMVEIVHHLRHRAEYIVGSQQTEPGDGWPYDRVLSLLNRNLSVSATAAGIVDVYIKSYRSIGEQNVTQSAVDTSATDAVMASLGKLGESLTKSLAGAAEVKSVLRMVRTRVQSFEYADYVDLGHLCSLLGKAYKSDGVRAAASAVSSRARKAIIANGTYGPGVKNSSGLSVWFPSEPDLYLKFRGKYVALDFYRNHAGWVNFLDAYHSA